MSIGNFPKCMFGCSEPSFLFLVLRFNHWPWEWSWATSPYTKFEENHRSRVPIERPQFRNQQAPELRKGRASSSSRSRWTPGLSGRTAGSAAKRLQHRHAIAHTLSNQLPCHHCPCTHFAYSGWLTGLRPGVLHGVHTRCLRGDLRGGRWPACSTKMWLMRYVPEKRRLRVQEVYHQHKHYWARNGGVVGWEPKEVCSCLKLRRWRWRQIDKPLNIKPGWRIKWKTINERVIRECHWISTPIYLDPSRMRNEMTTGDTPGKKHRPRCGDLVMHP